MLFSHILRDVKETPTASPLEFPRIPANYVLRNTSQLRSPEDVVNPQFSGETQSRTKMSRSKFEFITSFGEINLLMQGNPVALACLEAKP
jgi:hypothetical protein